MCHRISHREHLVLLKKWRAHIHSLFSKHKSMKVNGREELFKKKLKRTFSGILRSTDFDTRGGGWNWMNVCAIIVSNVHMCLSLKQHRMLMLHKSKIYPLCCRVLDRYLRLQMCMNSNGCKFPSGYFCFQLIRETTFAIKKEIVFLPASQ